MVIAGAVADWYFTPKDADQKAAAAQAAAGDPKSAWADKSAEAHKLSRTPVWDSVKRVLRFHLGTVAFSELCAGREAPQRTPDHA